MLFPIAGAKLQFLITQAKFLKGKNAGVYRFLRIFGGTNAE